MRSLSYDPVNVWPRIRQSESTLALYSSRKSACFKVNIRILSSLSSEPNPDMYAVQVSVRKGSKYFKVVSDWFTFVVVLYETILCGGPFWTQSDNDAVLVVVFFALLSRSIGFQIFGNLKDIPLI